MLICFVLFCSFVRLFVLILVGFAFVLFIRSFVVFVKVLDANATMVSMVVEALASLAEASGKGCGEAFLRRALFPLLEKVRLRLYILCASLDLFTCFSNGPCFCVCFCFCFCFSFYIFLFLFVIFFRLFSYSFMFLFR